jgi:F-type H+-transporting ATPase subunit gamma
MPSFREYNVKLQRLGNTRKMTRTMKMVSANKLRKAQEVQARASAFAESVARMARRAAFGGDPHPLTAARKSCAKAMVILITSDKGMCAGFNNNLSKKVAAWIEANSEVHPEVQMCFCGKRGAIFFRQHDNILRQYDDIVAKPRFAHVSRIAEAALSAFVDGAVDAVYIAYNRFRSALSQTPVIERLLPIDISAPEGEQPSQDTLTEPGQEELVDRVLPQLVAARLFAAVANSAAGEHGARMTAMDSATSNCDKLIVNYTLLRNRARQTSITKELIEIVAGAEALH